MRRILFFSVVLLFSILLQASLVQANYYWNFDGDMTGEAASDWTIVNTDGTFAVVKDSTAPSQGDAAHGDVYSITADAGNKEPFAIANTPDFTDFSIEAKIKILNTGSRTGIIYFRYKDINNYYYFRYGQFDNWWILYRYTNAKMDAIAGWQDFTYTMDEWHKWRINVKEWKVRVWVDEKIVLDWADLTGHEITSGKVGLASYDGSVIYFDDVKVILEQPRVVDRTRSFVTIQATGNDTANIEYIKKFHADAVQHYLWTPPMWGHMLKTGQGGPCSAKWNSTLDKYENLDWPTAILSYWTLWTDYNPIEIPNELRPRVASTKTRNATSDTLIFSIPSPTGKYDEKTSWIDPPEKYWKVKDLTTNKTLSFGTGSEQWSYSQADETVTIHGAISGHEYKLWYLIKSGWIMSITNPAAQQWLVEKAKELMKCHPQLNLAWESDSFLIPSEGWDWWPTIADFKETYGCKFDIEATPNFDWNFDWDTCHYRWWQLKTNWIADNYLKPLADVFHQNGVMMEFYTTDWNGLVEASSRS